METEENMSGFYDLLTDYSIYHTEGVSIEIFIYAWT